MLLGDILSSMVEDLINTRSLKRIIDDICWICHKIPGPEYHYPGSVIILFSEQDKVIRWRDVFPDCHHFGEIVNCVNDYQKVNFPSVSKLVIKVLNGNHASPETNSQLLVDLALAELRYSDQPVHSGLNMQS